MKKFLITFQATGGIEILAESEQEAQEKFDAMDCTDLAEELDLSNIEKTATFNQGDCSICPNCGDTMERFEDEEEDGTHGWFCNACEYKEEYNNRD
jgi:phage/plasmid primase-like uncharacterized protein